MNSETKKCPYCAEVIFIEAIKCKHCGELLDDSLRLSRTVISPSTKIILPPQRRWSPGVAAVFSFFIPGLGQIYKGNVLSGIMWLVVVPVGYLFLIIPGLILHLICIITAASGDPYKQKRIVSGLTDEDILSKPLKS